MFHVREHEFVNKQPKVNSTLGKEQRAAENTERTGKQWNRRPHRRRVGDSFKPKWQRRENFLCIFKLLFYGRLLLVYDEQYHFHDKLINNFLTFKIKSFRFVPQTALKQVENSCRELEKPNKVLF